MKRRCAAHSHKNISRGDCRFTTTATARAAAFCFAVLILFSAAFGQTKYEDRRIQDVTIAFEGTDRSTSSAAEFEVVARNNLGANYSTVKVRDAIEALYRTGNIVSAIVQATDAGADAVNLRFVIKRKTRIEKVEIVLGAQAGDNVTEQELLLRLNQLSPGLAVTQQTLDNNATIIQEYLRERGFFNSSITYTQQAQRTETQVAVTFNVTPNEQARVESFNINIEGFDAARTVRKLKLKAGESYTREKLNRDVEEIKKALRDQDFLAPELDEPRIVYDSEKNQIVIDVNGKVGPTVNVAVETEREKIGQSKQRELLPVKREGTIDFAAIIEGQRRLENFYQERGYFFTEVTPRCSVDPPFTETEASVSENNTESLCSALSGAELDGRKVSINYQVNLNRRLKLVEIRIEGTDQLTTADVQTVLESQEANALGFIPFFGYGRGYTSNELISEDRATLVSLMRELGYRRAKVSVRQGVSVDGENLILTFVVDQGVPTRIAEIDIEGNTEITDATLQTELPNLVGKNFSRARARLGTKELSQFYSNQGFFDAKVSYSIVELPNTAGTGEELVKVVYKIENEGKRVYVGRIFISGEERTDQSAILNAITIKQAQVLRATDIFTSEQNLYATSAFKGVEIRTQAAGVRDDGSRLVDVIVNVQEEKPRLITYGGGYSTDTGAFGSVDVRDFNLFGKLLQGGARIRASRLQQLAQIDFINPRFMRDGKNVDGSTRFSPLTFSAQYQRDSTVTRFFRSTFDKGTSGIVQRVDDEGNPIDEFGAETGDPTINRLTLSAETSRTISRKNRSILFARYKFEDVRLYNINSLLVKDLLQPDARIRTSGFGATFVRDTRENCLVKYTLLEIIARGEPGEPCRYNAGDPTRGSYLTADYNVSLPALGANIGFHKFQGSYSYYRTFSWLRNTTFAGRASLGLATVFSKGNRFSAQYPDLEDLLPISERFFAGGSTTLRGFEFENAGPRIVIVPQGQFRDRDGNAVFLSPFSVPFGGNALAIVNLEARVPLTKSIRAVPFYDGGNVFRRVRDIFTTPEAVADDDVFRRNLRALWSHTVGLGLRIKTPIGGEFGVDYGYLLNPPRFLIPQTNGENAIFRPHQGQIHFRFSQAF